MQPGHYGPLTPGSPLAPSFPDYSIHAYIEAVRYIFISKICFCVLMEQIVGSCCEVKINNDIFVSPVDMFSKVMFQLIRTRCFTFLQDFKVFFFYQRKGHICYCYWITEFISRM